MNFDQFWAEYPKKTGRKDCEKRFAKLTAAEIATIAETLPERVRSDVNWSQGKFIPNPATYLNQGRWDDEYERKPRYSSDYKLPREETDYMCPKCRGDNRTQRHADICVAGVPYFDYKVNGDCFVLGRST